ncbi:MAG: TIGR01777 family protein [Actinophytocola sp.]|nr:TIGR01777 family protein [Actinophytocola sp.]
MRIVVAGASGFIGSALVPELRTAGHDVRKLVRRAPISDGEYRWDPPAGIIADGALDGVDAVVNLCGSSLNGRWSDARKQAIRDSRIEPTEVLAEAVVRQGIASLCNASGVGYYGNTGDIAVDETAGEGAGFLAELCADWEQATKPAREAGARVAVMRTGLVLSGGGGLLKVLKPLFRAALGGKLGEGRQYMPWISLPDEVSAIRFVIEHPEISGPVNLCSPNPVTNAELTRALSRAVERPAPWFVPKSALRLVLGDAADEMALTSQRTLPGVLTGAGFGFRHTDLDAALADVV